MKIIVSKKAKKKKKDKQYKDNDFETDYWKSIYPDDYAEKLVSEEDTKEKK